MYSDIGTTFWNLEKDMSIWHVGWKGYGRDECKCPSDKAVDVWVVIRGVVTIEPWGAFGVKLLLDL